MFLAVVMDLFARNIVGWSMSDRITDQLALDALTMAYWRRQPNQTVQLHTDQGSQYTPGRCQRLLKTLNIKPSMSRRGNCHDNAVAESFFANLKKEKIRRQQYRTRDDARAAMFEYIEMFYDSASSTTRICIRGSAAYIKNEIYCVGFLLISITPQALLLKLWKRLRHYRPLSLSKAVVKRQSAFQMYLFRTSEFAST